MSSGVTEDTVKGQRRAFFQNSGRTSRCPRAAIIGVGRGVVGLSSSAECAWDSRRFARRLRRRLRRVAHSLALARAAEL